MAIIYYIFLFTEVNELFLEMYFQNIEHDTTDCLSFI